MGFRRSFVRGANPLRARATAMNWILVVIVVSVVATLVLLIVGDGLTWLLEATGLAGNRDPLAADNGHPLGLVKSAFAMNADLGHATGKVEYRGELWNARCDAKEASALQIGTKCRILETEGLVLLVRPDSEHAV